MEGSQATHRHAELSFWGESSWSAVGLFYAAEKQGKDSDCKLKCERQLSLTTRTLETVPITISQLVHYK